MVNQAEEQAYQELARGYLQQKLTHEQKLTVYDLVRHSAAFKQVLQEEVILHKQMQSIFTMPKAMKARIYRRVLHRGQASPNWPKELLTMVLRFTVPVLTSPLINVQRRCFNE